MEQIKITSPNDPRTLILDGFKFGIHANYEVIDTTSKETGYWKEYLGNPILTLTINGVDTTIRVAYEVDGLTMTLKPIEENK